jgi:hypothetical protein
MNPSGSAATAGPAPPSAKTRGAASVSPRAASAPPSPTRPTHSA